MGDYQVLFSGEVSRGADAESVRVRLARELGIDERKSRQLFSGRTVVVRSQLSQQEAMRLQERLAALGALCRVKNLTAPGASGPTIDKDASRLEGKAILKARVATGLARPDVFDWRRELEASLAADTAVMWE